MPSGSAPLDCVVAVVIATPLTYVINRLLSSSPLRYHSTAPPLEQIHLFSPSPSVSSVGGVPADLQKAGTGGNVDRDYGGVVRTPENWMI